MKKCSILASLAAIVLLSCSYLENPNSPVEEADYSQVKALNKTAKSVPENYAAASSGSAKVNLGASIGVAAAPVGIPVCSNELTYQFTTPPPNAIITSIVYSLGTISTNVGTFAIDTLKIRCEPQPYVKKPWNGSGSITIHDFDGQPARTKCYVSFCGRCISGYYVAGKYVGLCNKSYTNSNMTIYYQY